MRRMKFEPPSAASSNPWQPSPFLSRIGQAVRAIGNAAACRDRPGQRGWVAAAATLIGQRARSISVRLSRFTVYLRAMDGSSDCSYRPLFETGRRGVDDDRKARDSWPSPSTSPAPPPHKGADNENPHHDGPNLDKPVLARCRVTAPEMIACLTQAMRSPA
jgi:hypothetical protein